ncbi:MAG: Uma2 family endonuclease [Tatlockia sp.]|nr:Uma2 family endonuclease [Tatlockia sp.]
MLSIAEKLDDLQRHTTDSEQLVIINDISWQMYESLLADVEDNSHLRIAYLEGVLEIMSPSRRHEFIKTNTGRLLDVYFEETRTRFYGLGSTTFRQESVARGIEPDECYCINCEKQVPDIAIEIIVSSGGINSLKIYRGLQVPEVWFWESNSFTLYCLDGESYQLVARSKFLPQLDLSLLAEYVIFPEPMDAVIEFRQKIREQIQKL